MKRRRRRSNAGLKKRIAALRGEIARRAQKVYDEWQRDGDEELGSGGICDLVVEQIADVLAEAGIDTIEGGQEGDDHAYVIAYDDDEAYEVDIPCYIYERGSGYVWSKLPDVKIESDDVSIVKIPRKYIDNPRKNGRQMRKKRNGRDLTAWQLLTSPVVLFGVGVVVLWYMTRQTFAIGDKYVYVPTGEEWHLLFIQPQDGKLIWRIKSGNTIQYPPAMDPSVVKRMISEGTLVKETA